MKAPFNRNQAQLVSRPAVLGIALLSLLLPALASANAKLAIVIDDVGFGTWAVDRSLALPAGVSLGIFPGLKNSGDVAEQAHKLGHEVLLHLPMQPLGAETLNPGTLTASQGREAFAGLLISHLQSVPYAKGVSNHQGSQLTAQTEPMTWLMETLSGWGNLYFLDSRTTKHTVAQQVATAHGVPNARRHVFLDNIQTDAAIRSSLEKAIAKAKKNGFAVAIAHPHAATLAVLEDVLPTLARRGIDLVPVSAITSNGSTFNTPSVTIGNTRLKQAQKALPIAELLDEKTTPKTRASNGSPATKTRTSTTFSAQQPANLDDIPLAKTYPISTPAPGE